MQTCELCLSDLIVRIRKAERQDLVHRDPRCCSRDHPIPTPLGTCFFPAPNLGFELPSFLHPSAWGSRLSIIRPSAEPMTFLPTTSISLWDNGPCPGLCTCHTLSPNADSAGGADVHLGMGTPSLSQTQMPTGSAGNIQAPVEGRGPAPGKRQSCLEFYRLSPWSLLQAGAGGVIVRHLDF